ncbi:insulinase family protein [Seongchinamella unica]|uniref:Insulinase family protein n=1 Tax=Seongchinamella unica TaxID=2547392 RepID=A0A4R5LMY2_9GAMM|nr:pitrilysin family protein [Seongchinamella unica]TDG11407.1 insulinase family protein [Seongchinamella unica]
MTRRAKFRLCLYLAILLTGLSGGTMAGDIPGLSSRTLANGLEVIVIENPTVPLVTVEIAVHAGAFVEPPELDGLSHLYEHMFFKGNKATPTQEAFLNRTRELGAIFNGTTSQELVNYYFTLPSNRLREATIFMRDALLTPLFRRDELKRERPVVLGEFDRNEANPSFHLRREVDRVLWGDNFSRKNVIGDRNVLATATREQMMLFREHYYIPNNSALIFSGDVDPQEPYELAEEFFGSWARSKDPSVRFPVPAHKALSRSSRLAVVQPVQRVILNISWHGPGMKEDPASTYAADVLSFILSQPDSGWNRRLVESGLFDYTTLSYLSQVHTGPISFIGVTSAERLDEAHAAARAEIEALTSAVYFTDEELAFAKNQLEYSELRGRQQPSNYAHTVAFWWATGGLDYYRNYIDDLRKVTRKDINRYVDRYIHDKPHVTAALVAEEDLDTVSLLADARVIRPATGSSETALTAQKETGAVTEEFEIAGVPVLLRQLPSSPTVAVAAFFRGGLGATAPADAGLENLVWAVASKQTETFDKATMARELTRLGARLSHQVEGASSIFLLDAIAEHREDSLAIFLDALAQPEFTDEELDLARERQLSALASNFADPDSRLRSLAAQAHYGDHALALDPLGDKATLLSFGVDDLARKHAEIVNRSRLLISIAGDIDRATVERLLEPTLGDLRAGTPAPGVAAVAGIEEPTPLLEQRELPTVYIQGLFPAIDPASGDYAAHLLAHRILSQELWEEIRTRRNLAYAVSAGIRRDRPNAGFLYLTTAEPNSALPVIQRTVARLAEQSLTPEEVLNHAESLRTALLMQMEDPAGLAEKLGSYELSSGGWERLEAVINELPNITPAQVQQAIQQSVQYVDFAVLGDLSRVDKTLLESL